MSTLPVWQEWTKTNRAALRDTGIDAMQNELMDRCELLAGMPEGSEEAELQRLLTLVEDYELVKRRPQA